MENQKKKRRRKGHAGAQKFHMHEVSHIAASGNLQGGQTPFGVHSDSGHFLPSHIDH